MEKQKTLYSGILLPILTSAIIGLVFLALILRVEIPRVLIKDDFKVLEKKTEILTNNVKSEKENFREFFKTNILDVIENERN